MTELIGRGYSGRLGSLFVLALAMLCAGPESAGAQNPFMVIDIITEASSSAPYNYGAAGGYGFFSAERPLEGRELWRTDGTSAGHRSAFRSSPRPCFV